MITLQASSTTIIAHVERALALVSQEKRWTNSACALTCVGCEIEPYNTHAVQFNLTGALLATCEKLAHVVIIIGMIDGPIRKAGTPVEYIDRQETNEVAVIELERLLSYVKTQAEFRQDFSTCTEISDKAFYEYSAAVKDSPRPEI